MLRIGFVLPSSDYLFDPFRGDPFTQLHILTILDATLGNRVNSCLIDLRGIRKEFAISHIPQCDVYLHSVYTLDYEEQVGLVGALRRRYPRAIHIAGGPHINVFPGKGLDVFDALIMGEGEETIVQALKDLEQLRLQPIYRQPSLIDINQYPYWRRDFLPASAVARRNLLNLRRRSGPEELLTTTVLWSRGCPYRCAFCAIDEMRRGMPGVRFRSPAHVAAEIEYLKSSYGIQGLVLADEICLPLKRPEAIQHLEALGGANVLWRGQCRVDGITPELAKLAKEAGCIALGLGVESVSQKALHAINKGINVEESEASIRALKEQDIEVRIYIIIGLPGEPEDIVEQTWAFILKTDPDLVYLSLFTVRPGTEVFSHPERFGIKSVDADSKKTMHMHGRYSDEEPTLNFEYAAETPFGKGMPAHQILRNYLELQTRLKEQGLASVYYSRHPQV